MFDPDEDIDLDSFFTFGSQALSAQKVLYSLHVLPCGKTLKRLNFA